MYCFIKYTAINFNDHTETTSSHTITSYVSTKSNIGDVKELPVNADCPVQILLDYVCHEVGFDKNSDFDLCNEMGQLVGVKTLKPWTYATEVLQPKTTYFVVFCERNENGQIENFEILINRYAKLYAELTFKIKKHLTNLKRSAATEKKRAGSKGSSESSASFKLTKKSNSAKTPSRSKSLGKKSAAS